ncbi:MAG: winged helix-turn-helix transcriptional regulator [Trueperaceae bacterium]|nr:winged helix-turn-helix transcriptional regulator [Trueperaceae bacterium]
MARTVPADTRVKGSASTAPERRVLEECCGNEIPGPLPDEAVLRKVIAQLKGFADPTRLKILCLLADREVCVHDLVAALGITQSGVSHQLRALRDADLVIGRRSGRQVYYRLADEHVRQMLSNALSHGAEGRATK